MSRQKTRTLAEIPWLSLLPPEQRARLELPTRIPTPTSRTLSSPPTARSSRLRRPSNVSRIIKPLAAAGVVGVMVLAFDAPRVAEQHVGSGGSSAAASGSITASAAAAPRTVSEENRVALTSV